MQQRVGERAAIPCITPTLKHGGGSVIVWGSFTNCKVRDLLQVKCDNTPSAPQYINFFKRFNFLAGDQLVVLIGVSHISSRLQNTIKGVGEKEQTNNMLGLIQVQEEELCNIAFPCAYVD